MMKSNIALAVLLLSSPAWSAGGAALSEARATHKADRAHCMSGRSNQDRATCLKEADAAYAEARRGNLPGTGKTELERNATQRCDAQPAADRAACVERILRPGASRGSAADGGIIRRSVTPAR
jgi:hypothetical protein